MNDEFHTKEYLKKLEQVRLSDSSRERMKGDLLAHARFHAVREEGVSRSIKQVPSSTWLPLFKMTSMPIAILLAVFVSVGTSFAAQSAVPGDFLYPVKVGVNENIRSAFALGANAEAELQADLLEERLAEAQTLQADGRLTADTAVTVANNIKAQAQTTSRAVASSDAVVAADVNARTQVALESFVSLLGQDSVMASDISATFGTSLSKGTIAIDAYLSDMKLRVNTMRDLIKKYETSLKADVKAEFTTKIDTAAILVAEADAKAEADARASLDKAALLIGEVEAKLSTLGQVEVDGNTGIITDVDFSIDPMKIDVGSGTSGSFGGSADGEDPSEPQQTEPSAGSGIQIDADTSVSSGPVDIGVETDIEATSGLGI